MAHDPVAHRPAAHGPLALRDGTPSGTGYSAPVTRCRYPYQVTAGHGANQRGGPSVSAPLTGQMPGGSLAWVVCQRAGTRVGSTRIWYQTSRRHWVSGHYAATSGPAGWGTPAPRCCPGVPPLPSPPPQL